MDEHAASGPPNTYHAPVTWRCSIPEVRLGNRLVLAAQEVEFGAGIHTIVGRNGAGKTTFFRAALGLEPRAPIRSTLTFSGIDITSEDRTAWMSRVGFLPQDVPATRSLTVMQFLDYAGRLKGMNPRDSRTRAVHLLDQVGLAGEGSTRLFELSGGMRRRAGLAAVFIHDPALLLLDEPTAGLDPVERSRFHELVARLSPRTIVVISTHLIDDVAGLHGQVTILSGGYFSNLGAADDISTHSPIGDILIPLLEGETLQ